jgi:hypothetical protein
MVGRSRNECGGRHRGTGRLLGEHARQQRQRLRNSYWLCQTAALGERPLSLPISNMYSILGI